MKSEKENQIAFEWFCSVNDLEYDFSYLAGKGKSFYRSSETNKAFYIFKWANK